jgi:hypothetical protein
MDAHPGCSGSATMPILQRNWFCCMSAAQPEEEKDELD